MKLQQLRYIWEVNRQGLNVSEAAHALFTSQPGVSKQIRALEDELGVQIFERRGKQLVAVTPAGKQILEASGQVLNRVKGIKALADDLRDEGKGALSIATTHTQCRYVLPQVIQRFRSRYRSGAGETIRLGQEGKNRPRRLPRVRRCGAQVKGRIGAPTGDSAMQSKICRPRGT